MKTIYKIMDAQDEGYSEWYGTQEAVINYLEENKEQIPKYNKEDGFIKNLERYGLTFKIIEVEEK